jgi:uncharacterized protein YbjT (DUF2867 family)
MKIAVAGATGRVGRHVVDVLTEGGHEVVPISRASGVDIITGHGLDAALAGVDAIIDVATGPSPDERAATEFFTTATRNLQAAGQRAGVRRIVVVSIIGIDKLHSGYNVAKLAHEKAMLAGPIPAHVLRAAQFHEFVEQLIQWGTRGDVAYVPEMRTQIVAARTVAEALVPLAVAPALPSSPYSEIAGPREEWLPDLATLLVVNRGLPLKVESTLDTSDPDAVLSAEGALLPGPDAVLAGPTFEEWLER